MGMAERFADALKRTEEARDPEPVASLFADGCELMNLAIRHHGAEGARAFWRTYLDQFASIRSEFSHLIDGDGQGGGQGGGQSALVWTSEGALADGRPIAYRGASILDHDGERVHRFETIYDSAMFVRPEAPTADAPDA